MPHKKNILDQKRKSYHKEVDQIYFDTTKAKIWKTIDNKNKPRTARIIKHKFALYTVLSTAACITLILLLWPAERTKSDIDMEHFASIKSSLDSTQPQTLPVNLSPEEEFIADNTSLSSIEEVYSTTVTEDSTADYEEYLMHQNIDESIIIEELL